jgi:hypothetical protein
VHTRWLDRLLDPPQRERRRSWPVVALMLAAGAAAAHLATSHDAARHLAPAEQVRDVSRVSLAAVRTLADPRAPLTTYVRQASDAAPCESVRVGYSPTRAILSAVRTSFPGYAFKDAGRTLDQYTGLCAIEVRATHAAAVVVVQVSSPATRTGRRPYTEVETGIETQGGVTTKYALALTGSGWKVLVGASGNSADLPSAQDLVRLSQDAALLW